MRASASLRAVLLIGCAMAVTSRLAAAETYLFDVLDKPRYKKSWDALLGEEKHLAPWLARYAKTRNGPTTPGTTITLGGARYQVHAVCKAHDCGDNMFHVLFAPGGARAWGLLLKDEKDERFFGNPDEEKKNALRTAAKG